MNPIEWIRERLHRTCTDLITTQHDAVVDSAQAHHRAEQELAAARRENGQLRAKLAVLEVAPAEALKLLTSPMALGQDHPNPLWAAEKHHVMVWFALIELATRMEDSGHGQTGERIRQMAELHRQRLHAATTLLAGSTHARQLMARLEAMAAEPLTAVPAPRQGQEVQV